MLRAHRDRPTGRDPQPPTRPEEKLTIILGELPPGLDRTARGELAERRVPAQDQERDLGVVVGGQLRERGVDALELGF
jgi:hypothetical protein